MVITVSCSDYYSVNSAYRVCIIVKNGYSVFFAKVFCGSSIVAVNSNYLYVGIFFVILNKIQKRSGM